MGKAKKIIAVVLAVTVAAGGGAGALYYMKKANQKEVMVVSVDSIKSDFFMPSTSLEGHITTNVTQNITVGKDMIIDQVYVQQGDSVSVGDPLITFDMTLVEMELNIARLRDQQYDQQLDKAADRLYSLENGGPIEVEGSTGGITGGSGGTGSNGSTGGSSSGGGDNMSSVPGMDDDMSSVSGMDDDLSSVDGEDMSPAGGMDEDLTPVATLPTLNNGTYLAAAFNPILLAAADFSSEPVNEALVQEPTAEEWTGGEQNVEDFTGGDTSQNTFDDSDIQYQDPSTGGFSDGETQETLPEDGFTSGEFDEPKPTPTPALGEEFTDDAYDGVQGQPAFTDGTAYFYQILDYDSEPYCGTGTEEDPYVFLCSSSGGSVRVRGSFFNKMAGYNQDGTRVEQEGGSWFQLEFHNLDLIGNPANRKESCIGYYLIDGSLLDGPANMDAELEMTLAGASQFETEMENGGNMGGSGGGSGQSTMSREDAIELQKNHIADLQLNKQENQLKITKLEKKVNHKNITSKLEGIVDYMGDPVTGATTEDVFMRIKSKDGFYVSGTVSELMLDEVTEGTILNCMSYESGSFTAKVLEVSDYPISAQMYMGEGNPNVSYYTYSAAVEDTSIKLRDQDWLTVTLENQVMTEGALVIPKSFVRTEDGVSYTYKDDNGVLKKQKVTIGANVDGGYSVLIKEGLSVDDKIAFPYGEDVKDGAKTVETTLEKMYGY
jgi:hypothetical protein